MKKNEIFTHSVGKDRPELHDVIAHSTKPIEQSMPCTKPGQYVPVQKKESSNVILLHSVEKLKINHISSWKFYFFLQIIKITCIIYALFTLAISKISPLRLCTSYQTPLSLINKWHS